MNVNNLLREEQIRRAREAHKAAVERFNEAVLLTAARRAVQRYMEKR